MTSLRILALRYCLIKRLIIAKKMDRHTKNERVYNRVKSLRLYPSLVVSFIIFLFNPFNDWMVSVSFALTLFVLAGAIQILILKTLAKKHMRELEEDIENLKKKNNTVSKNDY